jgi:hypothetical protein
VTEQFLAAPQNLIEASAVGVDTNVTSSAFLYITNVMILFFGLLAGFLVGRKSNANTNGNGGLLDGFWGMRRNGGNGTVKVGTRDSLQEPAVAGNNYSLLL